MNEMNDVDAIDEATLRRALRLEPDERPVHLDAVAIAAAAERRTGLEQVLGGLRGVAVVGLSLGIEAALALAAFTWLTDLDPSGLFSLALAAFAGLAQRAVPLATLVTDPAVATATLAAVIFATLYERGSGRESVRVRAS